MSFSHISFLLGCITFVYAQKGPTSWTVTPFNAPSFPLAVKTPYVNAWDPQGNGPVAISASWPRIGSTVFTPLGWFTIITVDGTPYRLMGGADDFPGVADQVAIIMTPTRTSFLFEAGPVTVNATYLSPVEPNDLVQQSLPFSYYYLSITSDSTHAIKVYSDISGEWMSGNDSLQSNWSATDDGSAVYLQTQLTSPSPFQELDDRPLDGTAYHAMLHRTNISWQIANAGDIRRAFANGTTLNNTADPTFHPVGDPFDTFAIAVDLGTIQSTSDPIVWAVGVVRDPVVQFTNSDGQIEERSAYYWSNYSTVHDAILGVLNNFDSALSSAIALDNQILQDGSQVSTNYYDLLALSMRQAMGALDFTIVRDSSGNWNTSDVKAFLRGVGGIGSGGVNGVDVIYAASPIYLYLNPDILGYLLRPLLEYQGSHLYPNPYAARDIGTNYSMANGNNEGHDEGIEQSGNMLIMCYAHAQRTGETSLLSQHYDLLRGWADYLVDNSLAPQSQRTPSSDGISESNQTNLALKGILGIGAMARISSTVGQSGDAGHYEDIASSYAQQWRTLAFSTDQSHILSQYGQDNSYTLLYNLYAHKLLQLDLLPDSDFVTQTSFYKSLLSSFQFGLPLDSNHLETTRSDWMMFTAAAASDNTLRDALISKLHAYASPNLENQPFDVVYNTLHGNQITGASSPAQGAMFALLANNVPVKLTASGGKVNGNGGHQSVSKGTIIGGVIAGVAIVIIAVSAALFFIRRRKNRTRGNYDNQMERITPVKPSAFIPDPLLESHDTNMIPSTESQSILSPQSTTHMSSVSLLHNHTPPSSIVPSTSVRLLPSFPSISNSSQLSNALYEKQRLMINNRDAEAFTGSPLDVDESSRVGPPSSVGSSTDRSSQSNDPNLRREVEDLRRELERMRQEREVAQEAPPLYDHEWELALRR